jgi:hypothetical protein
MRWSGDPSCASMRRGGGAAGRWGAGMGRGTFDENASAVKGAGQPYDGAGSAPEGGAATLSG